MNNAEKMKSWVADIEFENKGPVKRALSKVLLNPLANYLPAGFIKAVLRFTKSELAAANWADPGGWRSMVISYEGRPKQVADKVLVGSGAIPMALRNRRRLGSRLIARLIDASDTEPVHVLCLGAGPGRIIIDAMTQARRSSYATLVDLNPDAFDYGLELADKAGLGDRVRYIEGDVRDVKNHIDRPPAIVKMIGICEYLSDGQIVDIAGVLAGVMPPGSSIVFNSISKKHGTDRFFRRVFGLHMIHRSPEQLGELFRQAGFEDFNAIPEPLGVYHIVAAHRKS